MILSGRNGSVLYDPAGTTPVEVLSLNNWTLSTKTDRIDVTCFGDTNKVTIPGMKSVDGQVAGFWNSATGASPILFNAADATTPGKLKLVPNDTEPTFFWTGLAWLDAEITVPVNGAPTVTATYSAAGPWDFMP